VIIQQTEPLDDDLIRDWPPVDLKRNTHLAYAVVRAGCRDIHLLAGYQCPKTNRLLPDLQRKSRRTLLIVAAVKCRLLRRGRCIISGSRVASTTGN
jgi:hypothetical protein